VTSHAIVIGSGAGASVAAWVLAEAGWDVTILEKGRNRFRGLGDPAGLGPPLFGGDEVGADRFAPGNPRTARTQAQAAAGVARSHVGALNNLPQTAGGGTIHWDAKVPRFWDIDFAMASEYGPVPGADVADWPFSYGDLAAYYDRVEDVIGVAGDADAEPDFVKAHAPRGPYQMPPGPPMYGATVFVRGAEARGYQPYPFAMAHNTVERDGRPPCNNCGFCSHFGCTIHARAGAAVTFLHRALIAGATLRTRANVTRIIAEGGRAVGVAFRDGLSAEETIEADVVVLAASAIESARIALLSGIGDSSGLVGRYLCFHTETFAAGRVAERLHQYRGRSGSHCMMEPAVPDKATARWFGLPYLRGGVVEIGGAPMLVEEAGIYGDLPFGRGRNHKSMMRSSPFRDHLCSVQMIAEDLAQRANAVDLDPGVKDIYGLPVARITYTPHRHELIAGWYWGPKLAACLSAAGASTTYFVPPALNFLTGGNPIAPDTRHILGTLRMGTDPAASVTDEFGRMHDVPNVVVCDGSTFPTSGAFNPTLTIMATSLRASTALAHGDDTARVGPVT